PNSTCPAFLRADQKDDGVDEEEALGAVAVVFLFSLVRPGLVEGLDDGWEMDFGEADVFAGDDAEALPAVFGVAGQVEFGRPEEGVGFEAAADGFLEGGGDFAEFIAADRVEFCKGHSVRKRG